MTQKLNGIVSEYKPDALIADVSFPVQVGSGVIAGGSGVILRGTVLGKTEDGKLALLSEVVEEADCILTDTVEIGEEDQVVQTYISGAFIRSALIVSSDGGIDAQEAVLRTKGIYLKVAL